MSNSRAPALMADLPIYAALIVMLAVGRKNGCSAGHLYTVRAAGGCNDHPARRPVRNAVWS